MHDDMLTIKVRGDDGYRNITVRVNNRTLQQIEDIVKQTGCSRNEVIGMMLDYALPRVKIESDKS